MSAWSFSGPVALVRMSGQQAARVSVVVLSQLRSCSRWLMLIRITISCGHPFDSSEVESENKLMGIDRLDRNENPVPLCFEFERRSNRYLEKDFATGWASGKIP